MKMGKEKGGKRGEDYQLAQDATLYNLLYMQGEAMYLLPKQNI